MSNWTGQSIAACTAIAPKAVHVIEERDMYIGLGAVVAIIVILLLLHFVGVF
jgi:hypothetical protein